MRARCSCRPHPWRTETNQLGAPCPNGLIRQAQTASDVHRSRACIAGADRLQDAKHARERNLARFNSDLSVGMDVDINDEDQQQVVKRRARPPTLKAVAACAARSRSFDASSTGSSMAQSGATISSGAHLILVAQCAIGQLAAYCYDRGACGCPEEVRAAAASGKCRGTAHSCLCHWACAGDSRYSAGP